VGSAVARAEQKTLVEGEVGGGGSRVVQTHEEKNHAGPQSFDHWGGEERGGGSEHDGEMKGGGGRVLAATAGWQRPVADGCGWAAPACGVRWRGSGRGSN
jgi:hypothetical protein